MESQLGAVRVEPARVAVRAVGSLGPLAGILAPHGLLGLPVLVSVRLNRGDGADNTLTPGHSDLDSEP